MPLSDGLWVYPWSYPKNSIMKFYSSWGKSSNVSNSLIRDKQLTFKRSVDKHYDCMHKIINLHKYYLHLTKGSSYVMWYLTNLNSSIS